jgi:hypothetical protein
MLSLFRQPKTIFHNTKMSDETCKLLHISLKLNEKRDFCVNLNSLRRRAESWTRFENG